MFSFFKSKPLLSDEELTFQVSTYAWLLKHFGGDAFYSQTQLVLPTPEFFPTEVSSRDEAALETFNRVKHYAGMDAWPCILEAQEEDVNPVVAPATILQNTPVNPLGTFSADATDQVCITYNPALIDQPMQLVATFSHELAHYLTSTADEPPPGGWENWEFATDIAATFLGFGVFMANSAFNFTQYTDADSQGWKVSGGGYLREAEHVYALAIFLVLKGMPVESASRYLKPNLKKLLRKAQSELEQSDIVSRLRSSAAPE